MYGGMFVDRLRRHVRLTVTEACPVILFSFVLVSLGIKLFVIINE